MGFDWDVWSGGDNYTGRCSSRICFVGIERLQTEKTLTLIRGNVVSGLLEDKGKKACSVF